MRNSLINDIKDKYYVYANFLPPGKHNTCILFNTKNAPKKNIYSCIVNVRPNKLEIDLSNLLYNPINFF